MYKLFFAFIFLVGCVLALVFVFSDQTSRLSDDLNYVDLSLTELGAQVVTEWAGNPVTINVKSLENISLNQEYFIQVDSLGTAPYIASRVMENNGRMSEIDIYISKSAAALQLEDDFVLSRVIANQIYVAININKSQFPTSAVENISPFTNTFREEYSDDDIISVSRVSP